MACIFSFVKHRAAMYSVGELFVSNHQRDTDIYFMRLNDRFHLINPASSAAGHRQYCCPLTFTSFLDYLGIPSTRWRVDESNSNSAKFGSMIIFFKYASFQLEGRGAKTYGARCLFRQVDWKGVVSLLSTQDSISYSAATLPRFPVPTRCQLVRAAEMDFFRRD